MTDTKVVISDLAQSNCTFSMLTTNKTINQPFYQKQQAIYTFLIASLD